MTHSASPERPAAFALERRFDAPFVARLALREKQVQQSYRPMIGIHKWFARRPGTLFRGLLVSEFGDGPVSHDYWRRHDVRGVIADPFMGGGSTLYEALRLGLDVIGLDVNPMAYWLVHQGVEHVDLGALRSAGEAIWKDLQVEVGDLYNTRCTECGNAAEAKYFLWVKTCRCPNCSQPVSLFPGYRIAEAVRHPREVYYCPACDALREVHVGGGGECPACAADLNRGNVRRATATCQTCDHSFKFAAELDTPPAHRLIGIEYRCGDCYASVAGRQFKTPDAGDLGRVDRSISLLSERRADLVLPEEDIPSGDETDRLHRWGYRRYQDLFSPRQLLGLGILRELIASIEDPRVRHALSTVFSDFLRYQNLLCRYDTYALKCQDIFSVHGFPVGLIVCENNLPGIPRVGSGSFIHFVEKYLKAKRYAQSPYETRYDGRRKVVVPVEGESAEASLVHDQPTGTGHAAWLVCGPSQSVDIVPRSLDGAFTDPPYFDNVQYAELMDFCYVWLRTLVADEDAAFIPPSTRSPNELTGNVTLSRGLEHFARGVSAVFCRTAEGLKRGAPLVFTYHHNDPDAYMPIVLALLDAELTVTAVLPAPGEMVASLHIAGTKSSVLDSVFVCRDRTFVEDRPDKPAHGDLAALVRADVEAMAQADYVCTKGDILCLQAGHLAASAVRDLGSTWDRGIDLNERIRIVRERMAVLADTPTLSTSVTVTTV